MILDAFRLDNQVAMVTGSRRGIGQATAIGLAEAGADIVAVDRSEPAETRDAITALGRRLIWFPMDLAEASPADFQSLVENAVRQAGGLDILVNNAGVVRRAPTLEYSEADWDEITAIDLKAVFFLSQAVSRHFARQKRGKIVNVASVLSFEGGVFVSAYTAAKSGVAGLTRVMANELAPLGINVNAIAPGYTETEATAPLRADAGRNAAIMARIPAGRWGTPRDLVGAVVYLASPASDYCHGTFLVVDGGWMAR